MNLTEEQEEIIDIAKSLNGKESLKINAFAGTGKTTTLKAITNSMPDKSFLYLAFNNDIVDEAKKRFSSNTFICTTHSLAYNKIVKDNGYKIKITPFDAHFLIEELDINYQIAYDVLFIYKMYCNSNYISIKDTSKDYIAKNIKSFEYAEIFYEKIKNREIDIDHSFYLKEYQLKEYAKDLDFDYLLLDEAQDTNLVTLSIIENINSKKILVGDTHQTIYQFRGSVNAMELFETTYTRYLTTTFRCDKDIVDIANLILQKFKRENKSLCSVSQNDNTIKKTAFITRTNSQIIKLIERLDDFNCMQDIDKIFEPSFAILNFLNGKEIPYKYNFLKDFKNKKELENHIEEFNNIELKTAMNNAKLKGYLYVLFYKAKNNNNKKSKNILVTAHSSKGLEWDKVVIENDFKSLTSIENLEELIQETNIFYVAVTRAKKKIEFKSEKVLDGLY